jgi:hypothetical protein
MKAFSVGKKMAEGGNIGEWWKVKKDWERLER